MNPDKLAPGERAASTSNRNFEGRQGRGGRTHLVSPAVAAATAVAGHFATPEDLEHRHEGRPRHHGHAACRCKRSDVDTDQIIPAEWLKRVERTGFEKGLFATWRDDRNFVLNDERYAGRVDPRRRAGVRRRLVARARRVGDPAGRLRRRRSRRASPTSSATTARRTGWCRSCCRSRRSSDSGPPSRPTRRPRSSSTSSGCIVEVPAAGHRRVVPDRRRRRSTLPRTASTTSASRSTHADEIDRLRGSTARPGWAEARSAHVSPRWSWRW